MNSHAAPANRFVLWTRRVMRRPTGSVAERGGRDRRSSGPDLPDPVRIAPAVPDAE